MSEAKALAATEKARDLIANPAPWGVQPRLGLEPLDVVVKFNRVAAHTASAFQVIVQMKLSLDGSGNPPFTDAAGLVGQGRTEAEALEMFFNWMADEHATEKFLHEVKAHEAKQLDALAQAELARAGAAQSAQAARAKEANRNWAERKTDQLGRKFGFVKDKVQV